MSDKEGALQGDEANAAYDEAGIKHIITGSGHFIERFNRTFKNMIADLLKQLMRGTRINRQTNQG